MIGANHGLFDLQARRIGVLAVIEGETYFRADVDGDGQIDLSIEVDDDHSDFANFVL